MASVADPEVEAALAATRAGLADLRRLALHPADVDDAAACTRALERCAREVRALQVQVLEQIERAGLHHAEGHRSAAIFVRHKANLSKAEAKRRAKAARMLRAMPLVAAGFAVGPSATAGSALPWSPPTRTSPSWPPGSLTRSSTPSSATGSA